MNVLLAKKNNKKEVTGRVCMFLGIFDIVSACVQEMQLLTCAGERSGSCPGLGKETASGWSSEQRERV